MIECKQPRMGLNLKALCTDSTPFGVVRIIFPIPRISSGAIHVEPLRGWQGITILIADVGGLDPLHEGHVRAIITIFINI